MRRTALLADAEENLLFALGVAFGRAGWTVLTATDGATALDVARRHRPDLAVVDATLPGPGGHDVCRRLRADPATRGTAILMLTTRAGAVEEEKARALGADAVLTKPFATAALIARADALAGRTDPP